MRNKRELKAKTIGLLMELMKSFVPEDQADSITKEGTMAQLGRRTYYKDQTTGTVHLGLCYKQVRKELKKNPNVTVADIRAKNKLG
jgi:hypothetical protein